MDNNGFATKNDGSSNYGNGSGNVNSYGNGYNNGGGSSYNGGAGYSNGGGNDYNNGSSYNGGNGYNNGYSTADSTYVGKFGYKGNSQFAPLSAWGYLGYSLLFCIPLVGFICAIVFACSDKNINRRSFARSILLMIVILLVLGIIISVIAAAGASGYAAYMADILD